MSALSQVFFIISRSRTHQERTILVASTEYRRQSMSGSTPNTAATPSATAALTPVVISSDLVRSFRPSKTFSHHKDGKEITSIDFDDSGNYCITSAEDESIQLYDASLGKHSKTVYSKKYGASLARFLHHATNCIYASTKEDDTIRYLSLHDNSYIRYFRGHKATVEALEVSPLDDTFLSSSQDNTVRLWDLRSGNCQGQLKTVAPSFLAFDPTAVLFSVGSQVGQDLSLYDVRNFDKQPFSSFKLESGSRALDKIEFSNTGKVILVSTLGDVHYLLDSFSGELKAKLVGHAPVHPRLKRSTGHACFSPDGRFVFSGSSDKRLYIWDTLKTPNQDLTIFPMTSIENTAGSSAALTAFNPKSMLLATADTSMTFWLPKHED